MRPPIRPAGWHEDEPRGLAWWEMVLGGLLFAVVTFAILWGVPVVVFVLWEVR